MRVIYLHGFASSPNSRKAQFFAERLRADGADVIIPALDAGRFEELTITGQYQLIEREVGGRPAVLFGSSMGGYLAALFASRNPTIEKLVLLAPAFGFGERWPVLNGEHKMREWSQSGSLSVYHYGDRRERDVHYKLYEDSLRYPAFPEFHQPALIFHGRRDEVVPWTMSAEFAAGHPNARTVFYEAGHELTEVLEPMWRETADFLELRDNIRNGSVL